ncbi:hypothetical protein AURDEDRAFT_173341 [Auricularia subglabra TFB-10046 SS5]|nr:hypothetical protein AURDEDRAFT_173341 [Auricularia subglabra TFB-10046 SS5]
MSSSTAAPSLRIHATTREDRRKLISLRRELERALREKTEAAFDRLNTIMLDVFGIGQLYEELKARGDKLQAQVEELQVHHAALHQLTEKLMDTLDEFDAAQPCCTHSEHCLKARRALLDYEEAVIEGPRSE